MKKITLPLLLTCLNLLANESETSYIDLAIEQTNDYRKYIHESLVGTASSIDNYYFEKKNNNIEDYYGTYGLIELSTFYNEDDKLNFDQKVKIKLQLPKLKDRLNLVFESDEERDSKDYVEDHTRNKNDDFNLSLLYNKIIDDTIDFKTKAGIKLNSGIDPFIKTEVKKTWNTNYGIDYVVSQALKQSVEEKLESTTYFKISKILTPDLYLHNYNEYYWNSPNKENSEFFHSIYLNQKIDFKNLLTYQIDTNIDNIDTNIRTKRYSAKIKYKHFIKEWLYLDVIPENYYKREDNFSSKFAIRFNLGMYFNKGSYR